MLDKVNTLFSFFCKFLQKEEKVLYNGSQFQKQDNLLKSNIANTRLFCY